MIFGDIPKGTIPVIEPRAGLPDKRQVSLRGAEVLPDSRTFKVFFVSGDEACEHLSDVELEVTNTVVAVTIELGRTQQDVQGSAQVCSSIGVWRAALVTLPSAFGERTLVDGTTGEAVK